MKEETNRSVSGNAGDTGATKLQISTVKQDVTPVKQPKPSTLPLKTPIKLTNSVKNKKDIAKIMSSVFFMKNDKSLVQSNKTK